MTPWYERLSILDCSFLAFEGANTPMHIGAAALFDAVPVATADGGIDIARIRRYVESRLSSTPRYRQRLAYIPVENHPVWVDDHHFDLAYHVQHTSVPRPGNDAQLQELCARLLEYPLDRARPLWEIWVIEGLADGRFALLMKVHHCMVDGLAGVDLLAALLSPAPDATIDVPPEWQPRPAPSNVQLLRDEVARRTEMSIGLMRWLRDIGSARDAQWGGRLNAVWELVTGGLRLPVATPLNPRLGPHRRFHWNTSDLRALKDVKNQFGGTVNDIVLSVVSGAVRRFFERRGFTPDGVDFRAAVPVNRRTEADRFSVGNRVSAWLVSLPIHEPRPRRRLQAVQNISRHLKDTDQAVGVALLSQTAEWVSTNVLNFGTQLTGLVQPFNLIVTNVPGPQFPLYLLGAQMEAIYPQVPLFAHQGLGIALFSYDGKLFWGFNGDWEALPDLDQFVRDIEMSFRSLQRAAQHSARRSRTVPPTGRRAQRTRSLPAIQPLRHASYA